MGLYDDEKITSGDFPDGEFTDAWRWSEMLENMLKTRQPEGAIVPQLQYTIQRLDKALAKWPDHEQLKKWRAMADGIDKKINKSAPSANVKEEFEWGWSQNIDQLRWAYYGARGYFHAENWTEARAAVEQYLALYTSCTVVSSDDRYFDTFRRIGQDQKDLFAARAEEMKKLKEELAKK